MTFLPKIMMQHHHVAALTVVSDICVTKVMKQGPKKFQKISKKCLENLISGRCRTEKF
jgi:hypothetical protein